MRLILLTLALLSCLVFLTVSVSASPSLVLADLVDSNEFPSSDEDALLESNAHVRLVDSVADLMPEQFRAMLQDRNPIWLQQQQDKANAALLETETESESESESDAGVDSEAESDEDHSSHASWMELETEQAPRGGGRAAGSAGSAAGSAGSAAGSAGSAAGSAGSAAGSAGSAAGSAGSAAGSAGSAAGSAGSSAGSAGSSAGSAGSSAGSAGSSAGSAGSSAGSAGSSAGISGAKPIVQPLMTVVSPIPPLTRPPGQSYNTKKDWVCWVFYRLYARRYGLWSYPDGITMEDADKLKAQFDKDPEEFCNYLTKPGQKKMKSAQDAAKKVLLAAGHPFINKIISVHDSSIRSQLQCASCWAEATIGSFEVALKKQNRFREPLSVQQILDCVKGPKFPESKGCSGGLPQDALTYMQKNGLAYLKDYPETRQDGGSCKEVLGKNNAKSFGWDLAHFSKAIVAETKSDYIPCTVEPCKDQYRFELDFVFAVETEGPYIAWVDASQWQRYSGGIFDSAYCSNTLEAGNHIIELLGYGQQQGIPYWLVKNSWGAKWGEKGFIKLPMGNNACGLFNYVGRASPVRLVDNPAAVAQQNVIPNGATASSAAKASKLATAAKTAASKPVAKTAAKAAASKPVAKTAAKAAASKPVAKTAAKKKF